MTELARHIVGLSGGKDSTALALALREFEPRNYEYVCTPTGNESNEMLAHWTKLEALLGKPLTKLTGGGTLLDLIDTLQMLPSFHARWCTRILKIEPTIEFMSALPAGSVLYVGLRADEEERQGIYGEDLTIDFPLRRWGWHERHVWQYLGWKGVKIPNRTDCLYCYGQRLGEWYALWKKEPGLYEAGVGLEKYIGHTFRSPMRDTWPASMEDLRTEFEKGRIPRGAEVAMSEHGVCRVCRL